VWLDFKWGRRGAEGGGSGMVVRRRLSATVTSGDVVILIRILIQKDSNSFKV
jgi:hypothetical protein